MVKVALLLTFNNNYTNCCVKHYVVVTVFLQTRFCAVMHLGLIPIFSSVRSSKPLVCLFPTLFKQNLLTFISLVHQLLPQTAIKDLLVCLSHDSQRSPWVTALMRQLERNIGIHSEEPLCTSSCSQRLQQLSQQFAGPDGTRGWADCFSGHVKDSGTHSSQQGTQKKRKSSQISLGSDAEETEQQSKRPKADICSNECIDAAEQSMKEELSEKLESIVQSQGTEKSIQQATDSESHFIALPQHIKVTTENLICSVYNEVSQFLFLQFTYAVFFC